MTAEAFFSTAIHRRHATRVERPDFHRPRSILDPGKDTETVRALNLACVDHRRLLFELGRKHAIKLHYGACLSMVELLLTLYLHWMKVDPESPLRSDRDRFILSKGHAAPSLYIGLFQAGFVEEAQFANYRSIDSVFQGHPDRHKLPGIDCTTGSLGQGLPVATGIAWTLRSPHPEVHTYCLLSDGECNEGSIWEAALIAANAGLDNLVAIVDRNRKSSYGTMEQRNDVEPLGDKWQAFGWNVLTVDGHDIAAITHSLATANAHRHQPTVILANTVKGRGIPYAEQHFVRSSSFLPDDQLTEAMEKQNAREEALLHD